MTAQPMSVAAPVDRSDVLLTIADISKVFEIRSALTRRVTSRVYAIRSLSIEIRRGEAVGLVGESGSGKSTTGRCALGLETVTTGHIEYEGRRIGGFGRAELRAFHRHVQAVFQNPAEALSPKFTALDSVLEPLTAYRVGNAGSRRETAAGWLERVGLSSTEFAKIPSELSGGQRQRVAIARALVLGPSFLVLDEPTSALDVSVQAQILNLLRDLQQDIGVSYLFISHNLAAVANTCSQVVVMYAGSVMEVGPSEQLLVDPLHPYTKALILASDETVRIDDHDRVLTALSGEVPSPRSEPTGCPFVSRCAYAMEVCREQKPELRTVRSGHQVACHLVDTAAIPMRQPMRLEKGR